MLAGMTPASLRASVLLVSLVLLFCSLPSTEVRAAKTSAGCVEGFDLVEATRAILPSATLTTSPSSALVAGSARTASGRWSARIARFDRDGWRVLATRTRLSDAGLVAIDGNRRTGRWAVGYARSDLLLRPYALRQLANGSWREAPVPRAGAKSAALTDVVVRRADVA
jgi:hypothetical protein